MAGCNENNVAVLQTELLKSRKLSGGGVDKSCMGQHRPERRTGRCRRCTPRVER